MKVVVDSNMLESEELREFLSVSSINRAVLTDYVWIEAYRHDAVNSIVRRLSVLKDFPTQVDVLRGTRTIAALDVQAIGIADAMIRKDSATDFAQTIEALEQIRSGVPGVIEQVLHHGRSAELQSRDMILGVPDILASLPEMQEQMFTPAEVRICRTSNSFTPEMMGSIIGAANQVAEGLFDGALLEPPPPEGPHWDAFYYRCALAVVIYLVLWIRKGSPKRTGHDKVHNDIVDLMLATLGTYFNGLMTEDKGALNLYWNLRGALIAQEASVPPDWTSGWAN